MKGRIQNLFCLSAVGILSLFTTYIQAAGYKLEFQSASVLADAGEAAVVEDAGTNWYNAAGLVYLPPQAVFTGFEIYAPVKFRGYIYAPSAIAPGSNFDYHAAGDSSAHTATLLPAIHYNFPLVPRWVSLGLTFTPSWGFREKYGERGITRYSLVKVYSRSIEISPSVSIGLNSHWSFGIGPDFHYFYASSKYHVRTQGPLVGTLGDSISRFSANRWKVGGHAGILFRFNEDKTRIGLAYRSKLMHQLSGFSDFVFTCNGSFESRDFTFSVPIPATTTFSVYHDVNPSLAVMGTLAYDQWHALQAYHARNVQVPPIKEPPKGIIPEVILRQKMHNTLDVSVGTHYTLNEQIMLRGSLKYLPTPTRTRYRGIFFPDAQKWGINVGGRYTLNKQIAIDAIYGHVFLRKERIHDLNPLTQAKSVGRSKGRLDLVGAQVVWTFC